MARKKKAQQRDLFADMPSKPSPEADADPASESAPSTQPGSPAHRTARRTAPAETGAASAPRTPQPAPEAADDLDVQPERDERPLTVSELTRAIKWQLEDRFRRVVVVGELANVSSHHRSRHLYFTLKDDRAQIRCVMWESDTRSLEFQPQDGLRVVVRGQISVYEGRGEMQLYADRMEPVGKGAAQLAFEQLAKRLKGEGLFERERKRPLPFLPRGIGLITSLHGAALRDMLKVLRRRHAGLPVVVAPAAVQGEAAVRELILALRQLNRYAERTAAIDVILVGRGGGSYEDLAAFNDERLARAIASSKLPVVSAVGHETDLTIADLVADRRALSPSEGAEIVAPMRRELLARVDELRQRFTAALGRRLFDERSHLEDRGGRLERANPRRRLTDMAQRTDQLAERFDASIRRRLQDLRRRLDGDERHLRSHHPAARLAALRDRLATIASDLDRAAQRPLSEHRMRLPELAARLDALSPLKVLERGYSVTLDDVGHAVQRADEVQPGDRIVTRLQQGHIVSRVESTEPTASDEPSERDQSLDEAP